MILNVGHRDRHSLVLLSTYTTATVFIEWLGVPRSERAASRVVGVDGLGCTV